MEICNITSSKIETGRNTMKMVERFDRLLNRVIMALYWRNANDLYIQRLIGLYSRPQNMVVEGHNEEQITGGVITTGPATMDDLKLTVIEPATMEDLELTLIEHTTIEDVEQAPKRTTPV